MLGFPFSEKISESLGAQLRAGRLREPRRQGTISSLGGIPYRLSELRLERNTQFLDAHPANLTIVGRCPEAA